MLDKWEAHTSKANKTSNPLPLKKTKALLEINTSSDTTFSKYRVYPTNNTLKSVKGIPSKKEMSLAISPRPKTSKVIFEKNLTYDMPGPVHSPYAYLEAVNEGLRNCLLVVGRGELNRLFISMYLKRHGTWSTSQHVPIQALDKHCFVTCKGWIYFIGGEESVKERKSDKLFMYNIRTGDIKSGPCLRVSRSEAGCISWKRIIYVIGGLNSLNKPMTHVETYDTYLNTWRLMHPIKFKRRKCGITVIDGTIFTIGGFTLRCESYNLEQACAWTQLPDLPRFCEDFGMIAVNNDGQLIAFRGFRPDCVCLLDLERNLWKVTRTIGIPPENVQDVCKCYEELYVVDKKKKIFVLNLKVLTWDQVVSCPKSFSHVFHIASINFEEVRKHCSRVTRDFEQN